MLVCTKSKSPVESNGLKLNPDVKRCDCADCKTDSKTAKGDAREVTEKFTTNKTTTY